MKILRKSYKTQIGEVNAITLILISGCYWDNGLHVYFFHFEVDGHQHHTRTDPLKDFKNAKIEIRNIY